jgi:hypothetical protein
MSNIKKPSFMNKYYIVIDGSQQGPFTLEDLQEIEITTTTLVWTENMENWTEAKNIEELKSVIKKVPPPIPQPYDKPIKVEAEISKKKEKIISPKKEVLIAKDIKMNLKLILFSFIIGLISFPVFLTINKGFAHKSIASKLKTIYKYSFEEEKKIKYESIELGYRNPTNYYPGDFNTSFAISYHNQEFERAVGDSIINSFITFLVSAIILIFIRYIIKGLKWVEENSKKQI